MDMKRKEVKGNPKKLPDMTRKGNEIRELAAIQGKGNDRTKRAGRPVLRQRVNPATGRDRAAGQARRAYLQV